MLKVVTATAGTLVASADVNNIQERAQGALQASSNNAISALEGADGRFWQGSAQLANATLVLLDNSIDWRDRFLAGWCKRLTVNDRVAQSTDYNLDAPSSTISTTTFQGLYTGTGAYSSHAGAGTAVSNGAPPVNGASGVRSYAPVVDDLSTAGHVYVYVDPVTYYLYAYNNTGAALYLMFYVEASGKTGLR